MADPPQMEKLTDQKTFFQRSGLKKVTSRGVFLSVSLPQRVVLIDQLVFNDFHA